MRFVFLSIFTLVYLLSIAQVPDTAIVRTQNLEEVHADKDYAKKYRKILKRARKVYPLALYAAEKLKEIDDEMNGADSERKKKKIAKEEHKELKDDFYYVIRDLYIEEGKLLMKLIYRETGMTVREIIKKYRGNFKAELQENMGKLWEQDLDAKYDPKGEDWIIENVIQDIKSEKVKIDYTPKILTKEEYKASKKQYKIDKKAAKKAMRKQRKAGS